MSEDAEAGERLQVVKFASPDDTPSVQPLQRSDDPPKSVVLNGATVLLDMHPMPTESEILVLGHIASGLNDGEISRATGLTRGQVKWAARSVIAKLGARNRPEAVARAIVLAHLRVRAL